MSVDVLYIGMARMPTSRNAFSKPPRTAGSGIEDGPEVPEVQRQHNVQRTIRLRRVGVVTGHIIAYTTR